MRDRPDALPLLLLLLIELKKATAVSVKRDFFHTQNMIRSEITTEHGDNNDKRSENAVLAPGRLRVPTPTPPHTNHPRQHGDRWWRLRGGSRN